MRKWSPRISQPFSSEDLDGIFADALRTLEEVGIECAHEGIARRLTDKTGASFANGRVLFPARRVEEHVEAGRAAIAAAPEVDDTRFTAGRCWACLNYCDPETQEVRAGTSAEAAQMIRLWDARGLSGVVPLMPGDVPPALTTLAAERLALIHSRDLGGSLTVMDPEEVRFLIDMNLAAGRRYRLVEQIGISPLRFNVHGLETVLSFQENPDVSVRLGGCIPMAGATCPLDPRCAAVQSLAERLALDLLCTVLDVDGPGLKIRIEPFDFQHSTIVFGSPEWCLYIVVALSVNEYLRGRPDRGGMFRSVAKQPDEQAACERTASVLFQALQGVRNFGAVGQLSVDEVFSPQQAIIDEEILDYVARVVRGIDLDVGAIDAVESIREGVAAGGFVGHADTVARFRSFYRFPDLFRHWNVGRWRAEGSRSILSEAWRRARERIDQSTHQCDPAQEAEIERIYTAAAEYVRTRA